MSIIINGLETPQNIGRIVTIYPDGRVTEPSIDGEQIVGNAVETTEARPVVWGKWIDIRPINQSTFERIAIKGAWNKCSLCGRLCFFEENFCPSCGADMREVKTV